MPAGCSAATSLSTRKPLSIDAAIALGRRFLGLPYTWGGTSSFGYDCSGFTQMLCRRRGAAMPRDADVQSAWQGVVPVKRDELKPGDLLFFGSAADHITHTGMYIGEGKFINATTWIHPVIQICDLSDPHWSRLLVASQEAQMNRRHFFVAQAGWPALLASPACRAPRFAPRSSA